MIEFRKKYSSKFFFTIKSLIFSLKNFQAEKEKRERKQKQPTVRRVARRVRPPHCVTSFIGGPIWFEVQFQLQVFPVIIQLVINFVSTSCENFPGKKYS